MTWNRLISATLLAALTNTQRTHARTHAPLLFPHTHGLIVPPFKVSIVDFSHFFSLLSLTATNLSSSLFPVWYKSPSFPAVRHVVTRDPLIWILSSLSGNPRDSCQTSKVHLQPLASVPFLSAPRPAVSARSALVESCVPRTAVVVVIRGGSDDGIG